MKKYLKPSILLLLFTLIKLRNRFHVILFAKRKKEVQEIVYISGTLDIFISSFIPFENASLQFQ